MGKYDNYAKDVLRGTFGERFKDAGTGEVDGTIDGNIAVEIGVGSPKQIRAAVLDLMFHPFPMKLLILVDTPEHETGRSVRQAGAILAQASKPGVVLRLAGTPSNPMLKVDQTRLADVVNKYSGRRRRTLSGWWTSPTPLIRYCCSMRHTTCSVDRLILPGMADIVRYGTTPRLTNPAHLPQCNHRATQMAAAIRYRTIRHHSQSR